MDRLNERRLSGRALVSGEAEGDVLFAAEPLSFWGGYDAATGEIIDRRHPLAGEIGSGRVMAIPATRGSSTTTAVLVEAIRQGTAPAALVTRGPDSFLALASIVAGELYGASLPVVALSTEAFDSLAEAAGVRVSGPDVIVLEGGAQPSGQRR